MFHVASALSGGVIATLDTEEVNGKPANSLKTRLYSITGISRFGQRIFLEDESEISAEEELSLTPQTLQLVLLPFLAPTLVREQRLLAACRQGDFQLLETCLGEPQDPNMEFSEFTDEWRGFCPIHLVAFFGNLKCLNMLLEAGADKDSAKRDGLSPLFLAALGGNTEMVQCLLDHGANMNKTTVDGVTPLFVAARDGHLDVVRLLVENGADINKAMDGITPLAAAAVTCQMEVIRFLILSGAAMDFVTVVSLFEAGLDMVDAGLGITQGMRDATAPLLEAASDVAEATWKWFFS